MRHVFAYGISFVNVERFPWFLFLSGHVISFERLVFAKNGGKYKNIYLHTTTYIIDTI